MVDKNSKPLVSIITVVFNGREFIEDAIRCVLSQTYHNIEYIVIDGASVDGTKEIIKKYENQISHFISESDHGIYDAMNKGIEKASGEIIGILNSDDIYESKNSIKNIVEEFRSGESCLYADLVYVKKNNLSSPIRKFDSSKFSIDMFGYGLMPAHPTFFVKRDIYERYGNFRTDLKIAADFDLMVRFLYEHKITHKYINQVIVKMRLGGISTSYKSLWINNFEILKVCRDHGIETNIFKIMSRYFKKILELF